jgi:hypothetical protein
MNRFAAVPYRELKPKAHFFGVGDIFFRGMTEGKPEAVIAFTAPEAAYSIQIPPVTLFRPVCYNLIFAVAHIFRAFWFFLQGYGAYYAGRIRSSGIYEEHEERCSMNWIRARVSAGGTGAVPVRKKCRTSLSREQVRGFRVESGNRRRDGLQEMRARQAEV